MIKICHGPLTSDFGLFCKVMIFVRSRFQGSYNYNNLKGLRALRPFFGPHLRSKYESVNKSISLHDFIRPIFLVFHFGFSLDLVVH